MMHPRELVSLWEIMQKVGGRDFTLSFQSVTSFYQLLSIHRSDGKSWSAKPAIVAIIKQDVDTLHKFCLAMDLGAAVASLERLQEQFGKLVPIEGQPDLVGVDPFYYPSFLGAFAEVGGRIQDELKARAFLCLTSAEIYLYEPPEPLFGNEVDSKFPQSRFDIEEAAKSLALGRYTACVFHLMRAAEASVAVLAGCLKATVVNAHGETLPWGVLVGNIKAKIEEMPKGHNQDDWLKVHALLHSCNRAYRTKAAHPAAKYTEEEANAAMHATRSFMREFADLI